MATNSRPMDKRVADALAELKRADADVLTQVAALVEMLCGIIIQQQQDIRVMRPINVALAQQVQALAAENAAMRSIVEAVAALEARETRENPHYTRDDVLHSDTVNVVWVREQARAFVAAHPATDTTVESEGE